MVLSAVFRAVLSGLNSTSIFVKETEMGGITSNAAFTEHIVANSFDHRATAARIRLDAVG